MHGGKTWNKKKYQPPAPIQTQFVLDCASFNLLDDIRIPVHNPGVSTAHSVCRGWCYAVGSERSRLLKAIRRDWKWRWQTHFYIVSLFVYWQIHFNALRIFSAKQERFVPKWGACFTCPVNNIWMMLTLYQSTFHQSCANPECSSMFRYNWFGGKYL